MARSGDPRVRTVPRRARVELELDRREFLGLAAAVGLTAAGASALGSAAHALAQATPVPSAPPPATDRIADLATSLDHDPERIFRFVQEEVRYEPYQGALRGAPGALDARAGNATDQAVLLGALLAAASIPHRFVRGALAPDTAAELLASAVADIDTLAEEARQVLVGGLDRIPTPDLTARPFSSPAPDVRAYVTEIEAEIPLVRDAAGRQLATLTKDITSALAGAGITISGAFSSLPRSEVDAHVWLQASIDGVWTDLDASIPRAVMGEQVAIGSEVLDALPDDARHLVTFEVIAERWVSGALTQETILDFSAFADALADRAVGFMHLRSDQLSGVDIIHGGMGAGAEYNAALQVGSTLHVGTSAISLGSPGDDIFGGALGGGSEGLLEGEASAEWLRITVASPGAEPIVATRTIFDRIGNLARATGVIDPYSVAAVELIDIDGTAPEYLPCQAVHVLGIVTGPTAGARMMEPPGTDDLSAFAWIPRAYHYLRDALMAEIALEHGVRTFVSGPTIASFGMQFTSDGTTHDVRIGMDLWHRRFGMTPVADRAHTAAPGVIAGVMSQVAERIVMRDGLDVSPDGPWSSVSVGAIFEAGSAQGLRPRVLHGAVPDGLPYPPEVVAQVRRLVDAGSVVVIPEAVLMVGDSPRIGWWIIDPVTGSVEDQLDDGGGANNTEYPLMNVANRRERIIACLLYFGEWGFQGIALALLTADLKNAQTSLALGFAGWLLKGIDRRWGFFKTACLTGRFS